MGSSLIPARVKGTGMDLLLAGLFLGGGILALGYANKRFGILSKLISGAGTLGTSIGQSVGLGLTNIPKGLVEGTAAAFNNAGSEDPLGLKKAYNDWLISVGLAKPGDVKITGGVIPNAYGDTGPNTNQGGFAELITAIEKNPQATADIAGANTRTLASGAAFNSFTDLFKGIQPATNISSTPKQPLNIANIIQQAGQRLSAAQVRATTQKTNTTVNPQFGGFGSAVLQESTLQALIAANAKKYPQFFKVA